MFAVIADVIADVVVVVVVVVVVDGASETMKGYFVAIMALACSTAAGSVVTHTPSAGVQNDGSPSLDCNRSHAKIVSYNCESILREGRLEALEEEFKGNFCVCLQGTRYRMPMQHQCVQRSWSRELIAIAQRSWLHLASEWKEWACASFRISRAGFDARP